MPILRRQKMSDVFVRNILKFYFWKLNEREGHICIVVYAGNSCIEYNTFGCMAQLSHLKVCGAYGSRVEAAVCIIVWVWILNLRSWVRQDRRAPSMVERVLSGWIQTESAVHDGPVLELLGGWGKRSYLQHPCSLRLTEAEIESEKSWKPK